jgi:hypothetical protein
MNLHLMLVYDDLIIWYHYDVLALDICVYYYSQFSVILWAVKTSRKTPKKKPVHAYADGIALGIGLRMCQMAGPIAVGIGGASMPTAWPSA